jgi:hypothetical protein
MKYSLPMWVQVAAIACLSGAMACMVGWSWKNEYWIYRGDLEWRTHNIIYLFMALPVALLAVRFLWCYRETRHSEQTFDRLVYWLGLLSALPAFVFFLRWFVPPLQKVREAGQWWA